MVQSEHHLTLLPLRQKLRPRILHEKGFAMSKTYKPAASVAALSIFMTGSAAFADVTAQQVWDDWKTYMTGFGYDVKGAEASSGGALTVSDVVMSMSLPEGAGNFAMEISELSFADNGDGTVSVQIPPVMPVKMMMSAPEAEDVSLALNYRTDGFAMTVSGDPANMNYDYSANQLEMSLSDLVVEGEQLDIGKAIVTMTDLAGQTAMKIGNLRMTEQSMTSGAVSYDIDFADPEGSGRMVMSGKVDSMGFTGSGSFPTEMDPGNMAAMLAAGFGFSGGFTYTGGSSSFNFQDRGETVQTTSSSEKGSLTVAIDETQLLYAGDAMNMQMQMAGGDIPFPIELAMAETGFKLKTPVSKGDQEQDFELSITLGDFSMSDMIWGIFDPAGQLPRDPATVAIDLSGKAKLFFDLMDPEQMVAVESGEVMPGELNALSLNSLTLRAAGAELTGNGAFTFDNSDLSTFDGIPAPEGSVDLALSGGNGLLDKLVAMGLLPEDQAMGARMMMGLFAVPGEGEDSLTSKIEVKSDGQILANGQRLK